MESVIIITYLCCFINIMERIFLLFTNTPESEDRSVEENTMFMG